ncbi:ankyrin repeat domain-containing protein, partial [Sansalvadorimonas verongulae]|uniref:ankyrin repeat domain-containing protein n=1 Tax=Sansalvadorimonas verongulae TaxID=2172824 RepID=UPI001E2A81B6
MAGHIKAVLRLIKLGVNVIAQDDHGATPLHIAARAGHTQAVISLIEHGAVLEAKDSKGMTPLGNAVLMGRTETALALVKNRANVETLDLISSAKLNGWLREAVVTSPSAMRKKTASS